MRIFPGFFASLAVVAVVVSPALAQDVTAVTGGTLITPGGAPVANAVIIIENGRITRVGPGDGTSVPAGAKVVDARAKFVLPGLADMHNHLRSGSFRAQQNLSINLSVLLAHGMTTVFNPSVSTKEFAELRAATAVTATAAPRFFGTGPIVSVKGDFFGEQVGAPTPQTPADARAVVKDLKAAGVDAIKVSRDDLSWASTRRMPVMKNDVLVALVDEAHKQGLKVFAHAPLLDMAKEVLRAGGDGLLHGIVDKPVDQELIDLMLRNRAVYVPTLSMFEDVGDVTAWARRQAAQNPNSPLAPLAQSFSAPDFVQQFTSALDNTAFAKDHLSTLRANLKRIADAKVPVVMGTDTGFFGVMMGAASHLELALMVEAGMTADAALRAATIEAARMLGRERDMGSIEPGKVGDLVVLDANPMDDIRSISRIYRVVRGGVVFDPAEILSTVKFTAGPRRN